MEGAAEAMAQALANAFQNIRIQPGPANRLTKFYGFLANQVIYR